MRRQTNKRIANVILAVLMLTLFSSITLGLGVGPSRQYISFSPGQNIQGELTIINNNQEDFRAAVYVEGDLAQYIKIGTPLLDVSKSELTKQVPYEINFPTGMLTPGEHKLQLVIRQFPAGSDTQGDTTISATMAVISQLIVKVPYPGKYLEAKLSVSGSEKNESATRFYMELYNFGTEDINSVKAKVEIFNPAQEKIAEMESNPKAVLSKESTNLELLWTPDVPKGTYQAIVTIKYDDKEIRLEQKFDVGIFVIDVSDISVKKFTLGDVAKFDILLFNSWNTKMENVFVEMIVEDSTGKKMTEFKTGVIDIPALQVGTLEAYWYTENVMPGIYKVKLLVHYAGKMTQKEYNFEVDTNSITKLGAVGGAVTGEQSKDITSQGVIIFLILMVLVLLIAMNIVFFYFMSKKLKGKGESK
jgi:hypothetical protein